MTKSKSRRSQTARGTEPSRARRDAALMVRVRMLLKQENWLAAVRAVAPVARQTSRTPAERRTVLLVTRRVYVAAQRAFRRGDHRLARQLVRALRRLSGPYALRAAQLEHRLQTWLRSQRKTRST